MLESDFKQMFFDELRDILPGCLILRGNSAWIQGFPDNVVLHRDGWFAFEFKRGPRAKRRPNQEYYIDLLDDMSYSTFVDPTNYREVLDAVQQAFGV